MTIYQASYLACLTFGFWVVSRNGDIIDRIFAYSVAIPAAVWLAATAQSTFAPLPIIGAVLLLHAATLAYLTTRVFGAILAYVSLAIVICVSIALFDLIPSEMGQGIAHNFYHYATMISYLHVGAMWGFGLGNFFRRPLA